MAAALLAAAPYLAMASAGVSAISSVMGGQAQGAAYEAQAAQQRRDAEQQRINAGQALNLAEAEAQRTQGEGRRKAASAFNQMAASGGDPTAPGSSSLDLMADLAAEGALDVAIQRYKGRNQANAYLTNAGNLENEAFSSERSADEARTSGYIRAGGTLLGGLSQYGSMSLKMNSTPKAPANWPALGLPPT